MGYIYKKWYLKVHKYGIWEYKINVLFSDMYALHCMIVEGDGFESVKISLSLFSCSITKDKDNVLHLETRQVCTCMYCTYIHTKRTTWVGLV